MCEMKCDCPCHLREQLAQENVGVATLLRDALDAITAHRSYESLTRNGKKISLSHPIWRSLNRAEATWHKLGAFFGEKFGK